MSATHQIVNAGILATARDSDVVTKCGLTAAQLKAEVGAGITHDPGETTCSGCLA